MSATDIHQASQDHIGPEGNLWVVIDTIPALVWGASPDDSHDFVNRRWVEYTGLSVKESLGAGWRRVFHAESVNGFEHEWRAALMDKRPLEAEVRLRNAVGQYLWFSTVATPVCDTLGNVVKWYGTHTDIEDRKSTEALLAELETGRTRSRDSLLRNEAYLAEAQRLSRTGSFSWRPASGEIAWSDETFRIYEYDRELEPTLELARQRIHPEDLAAFQERVHSAPSEGRDFEFEHRLLLPDGRVKYVRVVARAVRDDSENLKAQFRLAIDTIPGLVWTGQPDGSPPVGVCPASPCPGEQEPLRCDRRLDSHRDCRHPGRSEAERPGGRPRPLPVAWEEGILRIVQETVTNVIRHAEARRGSASRNRSSVWSSVMTGSASIRTAPMKVSG